MAVDARLQDVELNPLEEAIQSAREAVVALRANADHLERLADHWAAISVGGSGVAAL